MILEFIYMYMLKRFCPGMIRSTRCAKSSVHSLLQHSRNSQLVVLHCLGSWACLVCMLRRHTKPASAAAPIWENRRRASARLQQPGATEFVTL